MTRPTSVSAACAAVPGATEDVATRTLAGLAEWEAQQPVGSALARSDRREERRQMVAARSHVRTTQFIGLSLWAWWSIASVVWEIIKWRWSRGTTNEPRAAESDRG